MDLPHQTLKTVENTILFFEDFLERDRISTTVRLNAFAEWEIMEGLFFKPSILLSQSTDNFSHWY